MSFVITNELKTFLLELINQKQDNTSKKVVFNHRNDLKSFEIKAFNNFKFFDDDLKSLKNNNQIITEKESIKSLPFSYDSEGAAKYLIGI